MRPSQPHLGALSWNRCCNKAPMGLRCSAPGQKPWSLEHWRRRAARRRGEAAGSWGDDKLVRW